MMTEKKRDDFYKKDKDILAKRAAYICSNPKCRKMTIAPSSEDSQKFCSIGNAAHITAASEGGARYDSNISSEERKSINNGIFLCANCASMIDKNLGKDFSVELLLEWKNKHELWIGKNLNKSLPDTTPLKTEMLANFASQLLQLHRTRTQKSDINLESFRRDIAKIGIFVSLELKNKMDEYAKEYSSLRRLNAMYIPDGLPPEQRKKDVKAIIKQTEKIENLYTEIEKLLIVETK